MEELGIEEARRQLGEIIDRARLAEKPTRITRQGKPAAVVVGAAWLEHMRSALAAFGENPDPPVSSVEVRKHVVTLAGLLDGMRNSHYDFAPDGQHRDYWRQLQNATAELAALLPENAPETTESEN